MTQRESHSTHEDTGDPDNTADHQWQKLQAAAQDEGAQVVRDYVDHMHMSLHRMLGEATQEAPPFDELQVTSLSLLGATDEQIQSRLNELADNGVQVRVMDDTPTPGE